ncbi:MAG TPA: SAM-dependent methyltransferase [Bacteroidetes bacterium]|nr:SAM-dependent methyltransferase [Bacteroidota bacterium]HRJ99479.1 SAM-dependent methyltransferase [Ignavibacteria bacterium]HRK00067.1 SAM-dependent methyltransferase [Ignavibacteria bacterium]
MKIMTSEKEKFIGELRKSISDNSFVKLQFGKYRGDDREFQKIIVNRINLKDGERLSFNFRYNTKDVIKNFEIEKGIKLAEDITGNDFLSGTLFTTRNDFTIDHSKKRVPAFHKKRPSFNAPDVKEHNRQKARKIKPDAEYFHLLGITSDNGTVKAGMYDKFRQVDKFIETIDSIYRSSEISKNETVSITDMGSGKSYLTFAMYDHFKNVLEKNVTVKGIEQNRELTELSNRFAAKCGFTGLEFINGNIFDTEIDKTDITIALHACDTATDDAIKKALAADSKIIVLAPCCQKYVRKKMTVPEKLKGIFGYGIHEERLAVMLTDGLRAMILEKYGYDTKVFEFISSDHTARNTMIAAMRNSSKSINPENQTDIIKSEFRIDDFYLDKILNENFK